jgi:hypothetical protein
VTSEGPPDQTDIDICGLVRIRLIGAGDENRRVVEKQVGVSGGPPAGEPDISVRYVQQLRLPSPVHLIGSDVAAFTDSAFIVRRGSDRSSARAELPFDAIGQPLEITCERSWVGVPHLAALVNMRMLAKGIVPLHASAFEVNGVGTAAAGWSQSGKTETLLAFMEHGALAVADDWTYLDQDGRYLRGAMTPVRLDDEHLRALPHYRVHMTRKQRAQIGAARIARRLDARYTQPQHGMDAGIPGLLRFVRSRGHVDVAPTELFGSARCKPQAPFDVMLFLLSTGDEDIQVREMSPEEAAQRMVFAHQHHRRDLIADYFAYRYAFPKRRNSLLERLEATERQLLLRSLKGKRVYEVTHPHPLPIETIFPALESFCR